MSTYGVTNWQLVKIMRHKLRRGKPTSASDKMFYCLVYWGLYSNIHHYISYACIKKLWREPLCSTSDISPRVRFDADYINGAM